MSDVFLVKLEPDYRRHNIAPPFGILYLACALEKEGFKVKLYHESGTPRNIQAIVDDVLAGNPVFVGFSSLTGPSLIPSLEASREIKKRSDIPVVWGGLHATMLPEQTLENPEIDIAVMGEGDETVAELARVVSEKGLDPRVLKDVKGIGYKDKGVIKKNESRPFVSDLDQYSLAWHHLDIESYFYTGDFFYSEFGSKLPGDRIAAVITSRGCPWRCAYCYNQFVNKGSFRAHSAEKVISDIRILKERYDISAVVFEDDHFFTDKARALEIVRNIDMPFSVSIRANYIAKWGEDFVGELSRNGCMELRIGAESGSQRTLDIMKKDITVDDIFKSVKICRKFNIRPLTNFMAGIPDETWDDVLRTFDVMDELERQGNVANGPSIFLPYPGTPLYDLAVARGFKSPEKMEDWGVQWGPNQPMAPYVDKRVKFAGYYRVLALRKDVSRLKFPVFARILKAVARARWKKRFFRIPIDYYIPRFFLNILRSPGLKKIARMVYD